MSKYFRISPNFLKTYVYAYIHTFCVCKIEVDICTESILNNKRKVSEYLFALTVYLLPSAQKKKLSKCLAKYTLTCEMGEWNHFYCPSFESQCTCNLLAFCDYNSDSSQHYNKVDKVLANMNHADWGEFKPLGQNHWTWWRIELVLSAEHALYRCRTSGVG